MRAAVALLASGLCLLGGPALAAGDDAAHGSWTQARHALLSSTTPDLQQTDGPVLPVENGPFGALAFSAVRYAPGADGARLTLALAAGGTTTSPTVWACPTSTAWAAADRQAWESRPAYDCTRHSVGVVTGSSVSWDLPASGLGVALVPDPGSTNAFVVAFAAPTAASFVVPPAGAPVVPAEQPAAAAAVQPPPALPAVTAPIVSVPVPPAEVAVAPAPAVAAAQPAAAPIQVAQQTVAVTPSDRGWMGPALLAFLALLVMLRIAAPLGALSSPRSLLRRSEESA